MNAIRTDNDLVHDGDVAAQFDAFALLAQQCQGRGGFAAAGRPDQRGHPSCREPERHVVEQQACSRSGGQAGDLDEYGHDATFLVDNALSQSRFMPTVKHTIINAGASTDHGCNIRAFRLRAIDTAQSADVGSAPSPRKFTAAIR
jgi:hypothetical protein